MGRFVTLFFFSVATTTITHLQSVWGYYYLLPPIPHPIIYLDCTLFSLSHLLGAMGCMAPWVGIIGEIGVWAEGFASTDSQSYIYLIRTSFSLAFFLLFSRIILGKCGRLQPALVVAARHGLSLHAVVVRSDSRPPICADPSY
jgi:hypothetical protein